MEVRDRLVREDRPEPEEQPDGYAHDHPGHRPVGVPERDRRAAGRALAPLVPDFVKCGDGVISDLCVFSCRAKPHWNPYVTIRFDEKFYQMFREEWDGDSQRFVYHLRENPRWRLVVVVYDYHPHEVMRSEEPVRWRPQSG